MGINELLCCSNCNKNDYELKLSLNPSTIMYPPRYSSTKPSWKKYMTQSSNNHQTQIDEIMETEPIKDLEKDYKKETENNRMTRKSSNNDDNTDNINDKEDEINNENEEYIPNYVSNDNEKVHNSLINDNEKVLNSLANEKVHNSFINQNNENDNSQQNQDEESKNNPDLKKTINISLNKNEDDDIQNQRSNNDNIRKREKEKEDENNLKDDNVLENKSETANNSVANLMEASQNKSIGFKGVDSGIHFIK